jgi:hypothetical protein
MSFVTAKTSFIGTVITAAGKHPLKVVIQSQGIWRLSKGPVFNTVDDDGYTPALLMNI